MNVDSNIVVRLFGLDLHSVAILHHTAPFSSHVLGHYLKRQHHHYSKQQQVVGASNSNSISVRFFGWTVLEPGQALGQKLPLVLLRAWVDYCEFSRLRTPVVASDIRTTMATMRRGEVLLRFLFHNLLLRVEHVGRQRILVIR